jgi:alkylation response protein AidB-like acyl-CoA dehydrogenase
MMLATDTNANPDARSDTNVVLDAVRGLAPEITARAGEIEAARRVPLDLVASLTEAGCFRMLVPRSHGGVGLGLPAVGQVLRELATADGSVAWTVMIGSAAPFILSRLPRETFDEIYADGPDVVLAGAFNPTGVATPVDGGFRVTGQWAFASGCEHAHWFIAHCVVDDGRVPPICMMVLAPDQVEIKHTWSAAGLCGTGSHDFVATNGFVPDRRTFSVFADEPCLPDPEWQMPELSASTLLFAHVALGIAEGAMGEITALATDKVRFTDPGRLAANPLFQSQLGEADTRLRAARALLHTDAHAAWTTATAGIPFTDEHRARIRTTNTWVTRTAAGVVDTAYQVAGAGALFSTSPLQRRLRDIHALTQHVALKLDTFTMAGAVLAGENADLTFL